MDTNTPQNKKVRNTSKLILWSQYYLYTKPNKDMTKKKIIGQFP
jgi:hypothetical protein